MKGNKFINLRKVLVAFVIGSIFVFQVGCSLPFVSNIKNEIKTKVEEAWEQKYTKAPKSVEIIKYSDSMSESHQMMAAMILRNHEMSSDLSSYKIVYLIMVTGADGDEKAIVYADGEFIFPWE